MKIYLPSIDPYAIGGGWSFIDNFMKCFDISSYDEADIFFIPGATLVTKEQVDQAQADGKKVVLRVDNVVRNSRNRGSGMSRLKRFADQADLVIFQSEFAERLLNHYLGLEDYRVILNSADEFIFNEEGRPNRQDTYLYSKYSSDETKNWEMARTAYQEIWAANDDNNKPQLNLVGRFDAKIEEYGFDFFNGEKYYYHGLVTDKHRLADIYRDSDYFLYTYFNDACSNTAIEAMLCGVEMLGCFGMEKTGGILEVIDKYKKKGREYFYLKRMADEYREAFNGLI